MSNTILGKNFLLTIKHEDVYKPIACGRTMTFNTELEMIECTGPNDGTARKYKPRFSNSTASFEGITTTTNLDGKISPVYLYEETQRRALHDMKVIFTDENGDLTVIQFYTYAKRNDFVGATGGTRVSSTLEFQVTGLPAISTIESPESTDCTVLSDKYTTTEGQSYVTIAAHIGKTIIEVWREGTQYDIVTGTPGNRQVKFTSASGRYDFDTNSPFFENETVFVVWR